MTTQLTVSLPGDSMDYDVLARAAAVSESIPGIICEIGTRRGGSLRVIVDNILQAGSFNRNVICIDPYGNIDYIDNETVIRKLDYTNDMRNETLPNIYTYLQGKPINVVFMCMEDTEFFKRFADGVPFYQEYKTIETQYSFVFFDGPHSTPALLTELEFFYPRSVVGTVFVFDDIGVYPHEVIEEDLFKNGFELIEYGANHRKASYYKVS